jgi:hypothetical protein
VNRSKLWIAVAVLVLSGTGCKQGFGERCQVKSDCEDGLICSQSEPKVCGGSDDQQLDAEVPILLPDAPDVDAAIDAPADAAPDAPPDAPSDAPLDAPAGP